MALIPLLDCYDLLDLDPKTVRTSLKRANIALTAHPTDARIKCITTEQLELVASMHSRALRPLVPSALRQAAGAPAPCDSGTLTSSAPLTTEGRVQPLSLLQPDPALQEKVASLEAKVCQLSDRLADLALLLLRERDGRLEQRISLLETTLAGLAEPVPSLPVRPNPGTALERCAQVDTPQRARALRPSEQLARSRMPPLIEYSAPGTYVIVTSQEGELDLVPDSPAWFEWLASLSSFRFVGQVGRFGACRQDRESRGWIAHRSIHQRRYKYYLGVTERLTIAALEKMAAQLQAHIDVS